MIRPPMGSCAFMILIASWVQRNVPVRFVSTTRCQSSYVRSSIGTRGAPWPALLNSTSSRPKASVVLANSARTDSGFPTSVWTARMAASAPASRTVSSSGSMRRPAMTTE